MTRQVGSLIKHTGPKRHLFAHRPSTHARVDGPIWLPDEFGIVLAEEAYYVRIMTPSGPGWGYVAWANSRTQLISF